jgi:hypothetical protein
MESMHSRKDAKNTSGELNVIFRTFFKNTIRLGRSRQRGDKTLTPSTHRALRSPRHDIFQAHPLHAAYFEALHRVQDSRVGTETGSFFGSPPFRNDSTSILGAERKSEVHFFSQNARATSPCVSPWPGKCSMDLAQTRKRAPRVATSYALAGTSSTPVRLTHRRLLSR